MPAASAAPRHAASIAAKIDLQGLTPNLAFQVGDRRCHFQPALSLAGEGLPSLFPQLTPPTVQHVRAYLARPRYPLPWWLPIPAASRRLP